MKEEFKKRLYIFTLRLVELLDALPKDNVSRRIGDQLLRSGTSIIGNYIEAQNAFSKKEFVSYLNICLRSTKESLLWLCLLRDSHRLTSKQIEFLMKELDEFAGIFIKSIKTTRKNLKNI